VTLLAIESATELVGVALGDDTGTRGSVWVTGRRRHAEVLAPAIEQLLDHCDVTLASLEVIAVDVGPGLFTGLRVGVATACGLAQGLGIGVVPLSSLEVLAAGAFDSGWDGPVLAVVDARRGEVFCAQYERLAPDRSTPVQTSPPALFAPEDLVRALNESGHADFRQLLVVGDGALRYRAMLSGVPGLRLSGSSVTGPFPSTVSLLASERMHEGDVSVSPEQVRPIYLRDADARIGWVQRRPPLGES